MPRTVIQNPAPGRRLLQFRGDQIVFSLTVDPPAEGRAFVRTNLGQARIIRREIIRQVEHNEARLARDWFDIPMRTVAPGRYEAVVGLGEVGHFEAKCLFIMPGRREPLWPTGSNTVINVEPADTVCGNIIYNAFVRQFGPHKSKARSDHGKLLDSIKALDKSGYTVIPPSGTFRDLINELDFIIYRLGCRMLQLLPVHPTPTTYARMGRYGSPYAALSFTAVDAALAVFDPKATPLEQFLELLDGVHARHAKLIIDIAINHTGWAANLHETHPQWLARNAHGEIETPGAWGVVWADLTRLDFSHQEMWPYMADVFLTWCRRGVDGFRCDAGYMIPVPAWQYIIAKVREQFPDTIFLLEGLGGKIQVTRDLLNRANFNWAYSELFQNYDRQQIESYLSGADAISASDGLTVHFAETHDNNRLAATSQIYARMRTALCALLAPCGGFAFANGVEWFATEKINVHEACALNWGAAENQVEAIAYLSRLLKTHPAFGHPVRQQLIGQGEGNFLAALRAHRTSGRRLLVLINLDWQQPVTAGWDNAQAGLSKEGLIDLLTGQEVAVQGTGQKLRVTLEPGQVRCLAPPGDDWLEHKDRDPGPVPPAVAYQQLRAKALEAAGVYPPAEAFDLQQAVTALHNDPEAFCRGLNPHSDASRVVLWQHPADLRRQVMVPPDHFVLLRADHPFRARIVAGERILAVENSLNDTDGRPFLLLAPLDAPAAHNLWVLEITLYTPRATRHLKADLLYLAVPRDVRVRTAFSRNDCHQIPLVALGTNGRGAMLRVHADWQRLDSRYDALLAANLNDNYPEDRRVMLTRCRAWVVYQGYSQSINLNCLERFGFDYEKGAWWHYQIPTGQGEHIRMQITVRLDQDTANCIHLRVRRLPSVAQQAELDNLQEVTLIIRPDIEDRNFHHCTKAYSGPEHHWPASISATPKGFRFAPLPEYHLEVAMNRSRFTLEPEWYYMVHRPLEAERGLDPDSDLFSPGYFISRLKGNQDVLLEARVLTGDAPQSSHPIRAVRQPDEAPGKESLPLQEALQAALDQYIVHRGDFRTVIAGFPWFLDWGRDTLIVARGLAAAGKLDTVRAILVQFASFEEHGTLPNMIRGQDTGNRETSDGPLWLFTACADLAAAEGHDGFLDDDCNGRPLRKVLTDMARALISGTPNGIRMDPQSGLLFSPSHFTWMDTNYPAATPRQGYPIEIQALWFAALRFLERIDEPHAEHWKALALRVQTAIHDLFWLPEAGYLMDCRHATEGQPAAQAQTDDALRPNQLLAITLGAVSDPDMGRRILHACQALLVPGAIRSLADRAVQRPLAVYWNHRLLNDPQAPYQGVYAGDEDTHRKPAYHNGTAWTWLFPSFCEAWVQCYGPSESDTALAWLSSIIRAMNGHCVGQVPEILDGDAPHRQRGCDAQAWGVSEVLRVWRKLNEC